MIAINKDGRKEKMKWPNEMWWLRHCQSAFNANRAIKMADPEYRKFVELFDIDPDTDQVRELAYIMWKRYKLHMGDWNTPPTEHGHWQSRTTGKYLPNYVRLPDVIFLSPHDRAVATYEGVVESWPELASVKVVEEPRLREQEHGLATIYNDWRIFHALHPEQRELFAQEGSYWYRFPQGESVPDVIERVRSFIGTIVRDYSEMNVGVISHHLTLLAWMAAIGRWDQRQFVEWDETKKPVNCGLTIYRGNPDLGKDGKLELSQYNLQLY